MSQTPNLLTSAQVAEILGKSVRTVNRMAKAGTIPVAMKVGPQTGAYLFDRAEVERLVAA